MWLFCQFHLMILAASCIKYFKDALNQIHQYLKVLSKVFCKFKHLTLKWAFIKYVQVSASVSTPLRYIFISIFFLRKCLADTVNVLRLLTLELFGYSHPPGSWEIVNVFYIFVICTYFKVWLDQTSCHCYWSCTRTNTS